MRKLIIVSAAFFFYAKVSKAQDFLGLSTGNYTGVSGVMLQPASIADSRYKFDINLFSTGINYSNNYFLVNRDAILKFNKNNFSDFETFKAKYLSEAALAPGEKVFFNINNRTQLPLSFMATTGKKSAIALNIQSRSMIQGRGITQQVARLAYNGFFYDPLNNTSIDASGIQIDALNWAEAGLTYARVIASGDKHFFKAAVTVKYLAGVASLHMGSNDFRIAVNGSDSTFNFSSNNFRYNHSSKADFDMVFDRNFRPDASALGFDAGLVYEYRGNLKNFKYIRNDDEKSYEEERRDVNKYIFKVGVSLLDAGMFSFDKPDNVNSFSANITNWDIRNGHYSTIKQFDTALSARVTPLPNDPANYNVYLPTALSVQADVRFLKGLYLGLLAYRPIAIGNKAGRRFDGYGYYAITPRYERRHFGIYLPYSFSDKNDFSNYRRNSLGVTVRVGPLFVGSSNLGTMMFNKNLRAADVHVGLKIGFTYGKPTKAGNFISNTFKNKTRDTIHVTTLPAPDTLKSGTNTAVPNQLLVDYKNGKIYSDPARTGSIIIINNNYYNNPATDSTGKPSYLNADSVVIDTAAIRINKQQSDSVQKVISDTLKTKRKQLDSLINEMQLLRMQMDSANLKDSAGTGSFKNRLRQYRTGDSIALNNIYLRDITQQLGYRPLNENDSALVFSDDTAVTKNLYYDSSEVLAGLPVKKKLWMETIL